MESSSTETIFVIQRDGDVLTTGGKIIESQGLTEYTGGL